MDLKTKFLGTAIGSMPFADPDYAVKVSLERLPEAPIWPQLPRLGIREQMEVQYSEGIPCAVIDEDKKRMYIDTSKDYSEAFAAFYETYMAAMDEDSGTGDCSALAISPQFSKGIPALEKALKAKGAKLPFVKVQTTGPCSFALTIVDENKRAIYYNEEFRDVIVKALAMKCRWQVAKFKPYADNVICFIDEPILSAFGSSTYVSVKREDVVGLLKEMIAAVHADGGIAGIHCCGNTEWHTIQPQGPAREASTSDRRRPRRGGVAGRCRGQEAARAGRPARCPHERLGDAAPAHAARLDGQQRARRAGADGGEGRRAGRPHSAARR